MFGCEDTAALHCTINGCSDGDVHISWKLLNCCTAHPIRISWKKYKYLAFKYVSLGIVEKIEHDPTISGIGISRNVVLDHSKITPTAVSAELEL